MMAKWFFITFLVPKWPASFVGDEVIKDEFIVSFWPQLNHFLYSIGSVGRLGTVYM